MANILGTYEKSLAPDVIEPFTGYRTWKVVKTEDGKPRLQSPQYKTIWQPGKKLEAKCEKKHGKCKDEKCSCGANAFANPTELAQNLYFHPGLVIGEISMWGKVRTFEKGSRAEFAYPKRLWATREKDIPLVKALAREYEVEFAGVAKFDGPKSVLILGSLWFAAMKMAFALLVASLFFSVMILMIGSITSLGSLSFPWDLFGMSAAMTLFSVAVLLGLCYGYANLEKTLKKCDLILGGETKLSSKPKTLPTSSSANRSKPSIAKKNHTFKNWSS